MGKILIILLVLISFQNIGWNQVEEICLCDGEAEFPGGHIALQKYIKDRLRRINCGEDTASSLGKYAYFSFTVSEYGKIEDIVLERGVCPKLDQAIYEILQNMPDWMPAWIGCHEYYSTRVRLPVKVEWR